MGDKWSLYAVATRQKMEDEALKALFMRHWSSGPSAGKEERERERERESPSYIQTIRLIRTIFL